MNTRTNKAGKNSIHEAGLRAIEKNDWRGFQKIAKRVNPVILSIIADVKAGKEIDMNLIKKERKYGKR